MENNFQKAEDKGRWLFEQLLIQANIENYSFTSDPFAVYDSIYSSTTTDYLVEIKVRSYDHDRYKDWFLEQKKLTSMLKAKADFKSDKQVRCLYANFFSDDYLAIWAIDKIDPKSSRMDKGRTNTVDNGSWCNKQMIYLNLKQASIIAKLEDGTFKWVK